MDDQQSLIKSANAKKVTQIPVESTINQRPRRKIKHKFIKCNRDSPENVVNTETENIVEVVRTEPEVSLEATTSQVTKPKTKNQQKGSTDKKVRRSGRQNRPKDASVDTDDSNLQMIEIIDDPSDDPNMSIEEIIETCVMDAEEYERMINSSEQVCNDSSSNTATSATDQMDGIEISEEKPSLSSQNSCEKQITVGLVDCMRNIDIFNQLTLDGENFNDTNKEYSFEGSFNKSTDIGEVKEKVDIKPTTEFCSQIRTRRVTRLSSMSARRPPDPKLSIAKQPAFKIKIEVVQQSVECTPSDAQIAAEDIKSENSTMLEDTVSKAECSSKTSFNEFNIEQDASSSIIPSNEVKTEVISNEIKTDEPLITVKEEPIAIDANVNLPNDVQMDEPDISEDIKLELSQSPEPAYETCERQISDELSTQSVKIIHKSDCDDPLITDSKSKEKTKSRKDKKRTSVNRNFQDSNQSIPEEKAQSSPMKSQTALENQTIEQNKRDFISFMEEKFQASDSSKQVQTTIVAESEDNIQKQDTASESVKIEKAKRKKESHSEKSSSFKDNKSKRTSDSSKKSDKSFDAHSTHSKDKQVKSESKNSSKTSTLLDKRKEKHSKSIEPKIKHHSSEQDSQTKKTNKSDSVRSEKEIAMDQLKALEQKTVHRNKTHSQHSNKESSEKCRESTVKPKIKPTVDTTKVKSKSKEIFPHDPKDDKSNNSKTLLDQGSTSRKSQQPTMTANRPSNKSNRSGTDFILSECYLPKQVKYDESLYSIEALKAAQAAQEEQMKVDAEAARKAKEILAAKEQQAKAARAAARLAKAAEAAEIEEAKAAEREAARLLEEAEKVARLAAKAAAKAARSKQLRESSNKTIGNFSINLKRI